MFTYIQNTSNRFIELQDELTKDSFLIGNTYQDYLNGYYVLLNEEQIAFKTAHPSATIEEVFNMLMRTSNISELKDTKLKELMYYDKSSEINSFTVNGIQTWFTVQERVNYKLSIESAMSLGKDTISFFVGDNMLDINTELASQLLAQIQEYADAAFIVTKQHEIAINALNSAEEIEAYDFTVGYPDKLEFTI